MERSEKLQLLDVKTMTTTPGWGHVVQMWNLQREAILKEAKKANKAGNKDVTMVQVATLDGFDLAVAVVEKLLARYDDAEKEDFDQEKERQENSNG